jgi:hypothetical protein
MKISIRIPVTAGSVLIASHSRLWSKDAGSWPQMHDLVLRHRFRHRGRLAVCVSILVSSAHAPCSREKPSGKMAGSCIRICEVVDEK